ncbi:unnamed protein product [Rotaria sp. Silwood2]|nr:unnamed protein product [Rotaria sp. Silwood2]
MDTSTRSSTISHGFVSSSSPGGSTSYSQGDGNGPTTTNMQQNLVLYGYTFLFLFGYFGHINSIIIFLRHTLREISTSCLFICITISNIIYLLTCIYDFLYTGIGLSPVSALTNPSLSNALCRFRTFVQSVVMCSSAWLLLAISIDRWLRIRFPFQVKKLCTIKRVLFGALIILIFAILFNAHLLLPSFGTLRQVDICGPISNNIYTIFFRQIWTVLLTCLQSLVPTVILLVVTVDMFIHLRAQQRQSLNQNRRRAFIDRQILAIMSTSIFLFFSTQIPISVFHILLVPVLRPTLSGTYILQLTTIFNFVASINYAVRRILIPISKRETVNIFLNNFF